jgi:CBS domain-containing protein
MSTVGEILARKGTHVQTIGPSATVLQGAMIMAEHKIGALLVLDQDRIAGMFSERDILLRVVSAQRDPATTLVVDVMTTEVAVCHPETPLEDARSAMKNRRIRHLPVVNEEGRLLGLVSIGDLNAYQVAHQEQTIFLLHEYLYGRT